MLNDDGDFARGFGYLALYSAYLEDRISEIVIVAKEITQLPGKIKKAGLAKKIEYLCIALEECFDKAPNYYSKNDDRELVFCLLEKAKSIYKKRNSHSVHISEMSNGKLEIIQKDRRNQSSCKVKSSDAYTLANKIFDLRGKGITTTITKNLNLMTKLTQLIAIILSYD